MVEAVTFDFWNTLMWEEPGSLKKKRLEFWLERLRGNAHADLVRLERAHDAAHQRYVESWIAERQFRVEDAVDEMLDHLDGPLDPDSVRALAEGFSEGGRRAAVHPSKGVRECLEALKDAGLAIGIICDVGLTPSSVVRELLERHRLSEFFDNMSFSDVVGHYKPARAIFQHALSGLRAVPPERAAHVGDRRRTDVRGAIAMGMIPIRYNGVYQDDALPEPEAEIVLADLSELPHLLLCPT